MIRGLFLSSPAKRAVLSLAAVCSVAGGSLAQAPTPPAAPTAEAKGPAKSAARPKSKAATAPEQGEAGEGAPNTPAKKRDPAEAQRQVEAGVKLLHANKPDQSIQTLTHAIAAGGLPPTQMARALHARGSAYRKTGKPAQAISDLTSALWLKGGLSDADRQDAAKQRSEAYREAGLPDQSGEESRPATATTRASRTAAASAGSGPAAAQPVTTASLAPDKPAQTASTGGLFSSLFGGIGRPQAQAQPEPAPAPAQRTAAAPTQAATSGWTSAVATPTAKATPPAVVPKATPVAAAAAAKTAAPAAPAPVASAAAAPAPGVHARIALVRNDQEAQAVVQKLKTSHAAAMGNKAATTSQAAFGGMGSFVQVRVGPYASITEADAFCKKLKGSGLDCVPVDR